jgi:hypothetical protein
MGMSRLVRGQCLRWGHSRPGRASSKSGYVRCELRAEVSLARRRISQRQRNPPCELIPAVGGKAQKLPLHRIDLGEICRDEVIAAALAGQHLKTTAHEGRGGTCAAEMDECGEILLLLRACRCVWRAGKNRRDMLVQVDRRELDGMARDRAGIEAGEPAAGSYDSVPADTVACRLGVSWIGHLVHAHSARGGLVHSEGIPGEPPAPVGARHRIAGAFDLRQCGQQLGRDRAGGIGVKERFVPPPRFDRFLVERPADEKQQLARLADNVIDEVCQRECREDERRKANDPNHQRRCAQRPSHQARAAADAAEQAVAALPGVRLARAGLGSGRRGHADVWACCAPACDSRPAWCDKE